VIEQEDPICLTPAEVVDRARAARARIQGFIRTTPLETLSEPGTDPGVFAKCEHLQVTGSFKARGALSAMTAGTARDVTSVVTASTGNHGAAVAYAGFHLGVDVSVFAAESADPAKLAAIQRWGAETRLIPGDPLNAEQAARAAASEERPYISPYNDPKVIAGQGTVGLELIEQIPDLASVVIAVGGGGLVSGVAAVVKNANPGCRVIGASPRNSPVMAESVAAGQILDIESVPTLSDGTAGGLESGALTFPLCRDLVDRWITIDEADIAAALRGYVEDYHQLIEGSAAVALAARAAAPSEPRPSAVVLCGANIGMTTLRAVLGTA
jgi:threonine dehydratase